MLDLPKSHNFSNPQGRKADKGFHINRLISLLKYRTNDTAYLLESRIYKYYRAFCAARFLVVLDILKCLAIFPTRGTVPHLASKGRKSIIGAIFM